MQKGFVLILVLAIIIGIFAISNSGVVPVDFIFTEVMVSQAIVIFICVLLGAIIASIFGAIRQMTLKRDIRHLKAENNILQSEMYELKTQIKRREENSELSKTDTINEPLTAPEKNNLYSD